MKHHRKTYLAVLLLLLALLTACGGKRMRQRLQFVADYNSAESVFTKQWQPTVDSLVDYFSSYGSANERMTAYYLKGRVHHDLGEAPQALDAYQRATEQADTTRSDCDLHTLYAVCGQMADLFDAQYLPDNEMKALQMVEHIARKSGDKKCHDCNLLSICSGGCSRHRIENKYEGKHWNLCDHYMLEDKHTLKKRLYLYYLQQKERL